MGMVEHKAMPPYAYPLDGRTLRVVVRAAKGTLKSVTAVYGDRYAPVEEAETARLERAGSDARHDYFQGELRLSPPRFRYAFLLDDGTDRRWLSEAGLSDAPPRHGFFQYPYINAADLYDVPDWLVDGVVYQIFPERFANGNPANDPPGVRPWHDQRPTATSFYGGDLEGVIQRLSHLEELGVTVLYLTPVFASPSNHKYDTTDYYQVDPHFGDQETLKELVRQCHARGIRVILDAVFNHSGFDFFAFKDVRERGAESPYANWFHIHGFPVRTEPVPNYETFANALPFMPKLRTETPELRAYLLDVARYWIETCDIDGWRIDVANEVDHAFWREFRRTVRAAKPDAYIVGEIWHEALPWLLGDQFDGVTNYPVREAALDFFARGRIGADGFAEALVQNMFAYPLPALQGSWNLLGSHDTERIMTACGGDPRKAALAAVFNMTWIGTPMIYYGDEIGMEGETDPDCRRPMIWDRAGAAAGGPSGEGVSGGGSSGDVVAPDAERAAAAGDKPARRGRWNEPLFQLYKRLVRLRRETDALRRGEARILHADPAANTVAYRRGGEEDGVVIVLNNSPRAREVPTAELFGARGGAGRGGAGAGRAGVGNGNGAADDRHADDGAGAKAHGPDDAVSRRQDAGAWTAAVLLDCTDGIAFGAQWPVGPQDGSVRVPPYGALLLKRS